MAIIGEGGIISPRFFRRYDANSIMPYSDNIILQNNHDIRSELSGGGLIDIIKVNITNDTYIKGYSYIVFVLEDGGTGHWAFYDQTAGFTDYVAAFRRGDYQLVIGSYTGVAGMKSGILIYKDTEPTADPGDGFALFPDASGGQAKIRTEGGANCEVLLGETGVYTGDGAYTQTITTNLCKIIFLMVWREASSGGEDSYIYHAAPVHGFTSILTNSLHTGQAEASRFHLVGGMSDGEFTVSDNNADEHPNKDEEEYNYFIAGY
jgi:hypothetical protein